MELPGAGTYVLLMLFAVYTQVSLFISRLDILCLFSYMEINSSQRGFAVDHTDI